MYNYTTKYSSTGYIKPKETILNEIKKYEIIDDMDSFNNNLENLIRFLKSNQKIDSDLGLNILKNEFESQTKEIVGKIVREKLNK